MFRPFPLFVGLRYSLTRKRNFFLSFVSLISMLGISLGVLILIVALSVMNGSIAVLRDEALKSVPHVTVEGGAVTNDWQLAANAALQDVSVLGVSPFMEGEVTVRYQGRDSFIQLRGIDPEREASVLSNPGRIYDDMLELLAQTDNGIILGTQLAGQLGIYGTSEISVIPLSSLLRRDFDDSRGLQVIGFADFGVYGNNNLALVNLAQAADMFADAPGVNLQLRLRVDDVFAAEEIAGRALNEFDGLNIAPWNVTRASLFNALGMEKIMTTFMLLMIVVIGAVNIVSTLVMVVSDKSADIAILRTMGASSGNIMQVFMVQGLIAGVIGTVAGAVLGIILALSITDLSLMLERLVNSLLENGNFYLISHLESQVNVGEVTLVCVAALIISFIATLYPAYRASRVQPVEVLRYE